MAAPIGHRDLWLFLGLTFVLGWSLMALIPLLGLEPGSRASSILIALYAFAPALSTWLVERIAFFRTELAARTGLLIRVEGIRWTRWWALAWVMTPVLLLSSVGISVAMGTLTLDLEDFSTLRAAVLASEGGEQMLQDVEPRTMFFANLITAMVIAPLTSALPVFGPEWGFRGWLLPRLWSSRGPWAALVGHGIIMGIWMLPLVFVGARYAGYVLPGLGLLLLHTLLLSFLLGWLRLSTGSIWPAVIVQASVYGLMPVLGLMPELGVEVNPLMSGFFGLPGILLLAAIVLLLLVLGRLPRPPSPAPLPTDAWAKTAPPAPRTS